MGINRHLRDAMRAHEQVTKAMPGPSEREAMRLQTLAARQAMPSAAQLEAFRRQAEEARRVARSIDPATLQALRQAYSSQRVLEAVEAARWSLGDRGLLAAHVLTDRELFFRPPAERGSSAGTPSAERVREAGELATSDEVRELLERAAPGPLEAEAEAYLEEEELPGLDETALEDSDPELAAPEGEVVLYGIDVKLSDAKKVALVLLVALNAGEVSSGLAAEIRGALSDLADVVGGLSWLLWGRQERGAVPEGSGVAGGDLLRFAGSIAAEDLDAMEGAIEEDCERVSPVER